MEDSKSEITPEQLQQTNNPALARLADVFSDQKSQTEYSRSHSRHNRSGDYSRMSHRHNRS